MKAPRFKVMTYLIMALFAGYLMGSCEDCDDGNNFEDQQITQPIDSLSVDN